MYRYLRRFCLDVEGTMIQIYVHGGEQLDSCGDGSVATPVRNGNSSTEIIREAG